MPRPRKVSETKIKNAHKKAKSMRGMATLMGVTKATAYSYCYHYHLVPLKGKPGPERLFTDDEFTAAYVLCDTAGEMATELSVSTACINYHLRKNKLCAPGAQKEDDNTELFDSYRGLVGIGDLAKKHDVTRLTIRNRLKRHLIENLPEGFPSPNILSDVKLINEITRNDELFNDPDTLADITGLPSAQIVRYVNELWEFKKSEDDDE
ncbi:hypothetical protein LCGC14_2273120 [marine sediment metagenome]|uniref:Uncharacterized protein n=1 Tax=marine sediment metagenome TaxID=412755 RepID=A0A0F9DIN0_9ZZZZ